MRNIRTRIQLCATVVAVILLTACGPRRAEPVAPLEEAELKLTTVEISGSFGIAEREMVEAFEELHPEVTIRRGSYGSFGPEALLERNEVPDIVAVWSGQQLRNIMRRGLVSDLTDVWIRSEGDLSFPQTFQSVTHFEGSPYYLPLGYSWPAIYYNRAIF